MSKIYFAKIIKGIAGFYYCIILDEGERKEKRDSKVFGFY